MKKYRLKKELPGIPVGTIYEFNYRYNSFVAQIDHYNYLSSTNFIYLLDQNHFWFPDWFEEVEETC